jgi:hypothetical protein
MTYTVIVNRIEWHPAAGDHALPLGRNQVHDSRNLAYRHRRTTATLRTVLHDRHIPILDQGQVGSCTGNGEVGVLGCDPNWSALPQFSPDTAVTLDEALALRLYSMAETIDGDGPYPPNDNGSSGPSAAKAAMRLGLISGYTHCLSLQDVLDALQGQAVSIGINWYDSFDSPPSSGLLSISPGAQVRGGHEPMLRGVDVSARTVFGDNSWGESWGVKGSFSMAWATLDRLLHEGGDGTVSVPLSQPAPVPVPPQPVPVHRDPADVQLWNQTTQWAGMHHAGGNRKAAMDVLNWAHEKGLG